MFASIAILTDEWPICRHFLAIVGVVSKKFLE